MASRNRRNALKVLFYAVVAGVCFAFSLYALLGVWQAAGRFSGDRAMANYLFWGPLTVIFFVAAIFCGYHALKLSLLGIKTSASNKAD